jgi:predicted MFS family arabinose efflux permease
VFLRQQRKAGSLLPLELLQQPEFKRVALITMAYGAGMYGSIYLIPLWLQDGLAVSATMTGNLLLVGGVALALSIMLAGRLVDRFSAKPILMLGMISFTLSCILFSLVGELAWITLGIVLSRIGLGSIIPSLYPSIARSVDEADVRQAMAFTTLLRQGGGVIGVVVIGLLLSSLESVPLGEARPTQLYAGLFLLFAMLFAGAAMVARKLGN